MKPQRTFTFLGAMFALSFLALPCGAQTTAAQQPQGVSEQQLAQFLKRFPKADADKDGKLSLAEAQAYLQTDPAARALVAGVSTKPAEFAAGAEGTRVFVCAHSYMIYTADILPIIAKGADVPHLKAGQQMIGGSRTIAHWRLLDELNEAKKALREGRVDVLTLSPHLQLPDEGIDLFTKLGLEKNPKLRVLVQASWVPWDGKAKSDGFTNALRDAVTAEEVRAMRDAHHGGFLKQLEQQVTALNAATGHDAVHIIPASAAVFRLRELVADGQAPGLAKQSELFSDDHGHPSQVLALLVSYCHFAAIHQRTPVGLPIPPQLKANPQAEKLNALLQTIAWDAVTNHPLSGVKADKP